MSKKDFDNPELSSVERGTEPVEEAEVRDIAGEVVESGGWLRRLALLLTLLLLTLVAAGSVFGYQYWKQMQDTLLQMEQVVQRSGEDQHRFTQDLEQIRDAFEQQRSQLQAQQQALLVQEQKLYTEQAKLQKESAEIRSALVSDTPLPRLPDLLGHAGQQETPRGLESATDINPPKLEVVGEV